MLYAQHCTAENTGKFTQFPQKPHQIHFFKSSEEETSSATPAARTQLEIRAVLTVVAVGARVGRHGAVAGEVLPLLDAHAHVGARVLLAGGARTWDGGGKGEREREVPQEEKKKEKNESSQRRHIDKAAAACRERERNATPEKIQRGRRGAKQWHHKKSHGDLEGLEAQRVTFSDIYWLQMKTKIPFGKILK